MWSFGRLTKAPIQTSYYMIRRILPALIFSICPQQKYLVVTFPFNSNIMKKTITNSLLLLVLLCLYVVPGIAQTFDYADTKEKVYVQTSHVFKTRRNHVFQNI